MATSHQPYEYSPHTKTPIQQRASKVSPANYAATQQTTTEAVPVAPLQHKPRSHWLVFFGLGMTMVIASVLIWNVIVAPFVQSVLDTWQYGNARISALSVVVGHADSPQHPTRLLAFMLQGHVTIIELPGGNGSSVHIYDGPMFPGNSKENVGVTLDVQDANQ